MSHYPAPEEIEQLSREVHQRISNENIAYNQWQTGIEEKHKLRIDEIIIEVVREVYGSIVLPLVRQLRRLFFPE